MWFNKCGCVRVFAGVCGSVQVCTCVGTCAGVCGWTEYQIMIRVFMQRTLVYILYKNFLSNSKIKHFLKTINPRAEYWLNKFIPEKYYPCLLACTIPMSCKWDIKHDFIQLMGKKEFRLVYIVVNTCFQEIIGITLLHQTESTQNKSPLFLIPYPRI